MRPAIDRAIRIFALALAAAMTSVAAEPTRHTGAGIARRTAFHDRQRAERVEVEVVGTFTQ